MKIKFDKETMPDELYNALLQHFVNEAVGLGVEVSKHTRFENWVWRAKDMQSERLIHKINQQRDELEAVVKKVAEAHFDLSLHKQHDTLTYLKKVADKALAKLEEEV